MSAFMKREGYSARPHGFRATFRTWVEEKTETPFEVKEDVLGHVVDNAVVQAYQRFDRMNQRRTPLQKWVNFLKYCILTMSLLKFPKTNQPSQNSFTSAPELQREVQHPPNLL